MAKGKTKGTAAAKERHKRSWTNCNKVGGKKDKRVEKSSHGKFKSREELKKHELAVRNKPEYIARRKERAKIRELYRKPSWNRVTDKITTKNIKVQAEETE